MGGQRRCGLGLAICKEIIELHGGQLIVDSERGAGTVVAFRVPLMHEA
ncbi:ATP-binding protein [Paenibacillus alkaliterrae]